MIVGLTGIFLILETILPTFPLLRHCCMIFVVSLFFRLRKFPSIPSVLKVFNLKKVDFLSNTLVFIVIILRLFSFILTSSKCH